MNDLDADILKNDDTENNQPSCDRARHHGRRRLLRRWSPFLLPSISSPWSVKSIDGIYPSSHLIFIIVGHPPGRHAAIGPMSANEVDWLEPTEAPARYVMRTTNNPGWKRNTIWRELHHWYIIRDADSETCWDFIAAGVRRIVTGWVVVHFTTLYWLPQILFEFHILTIF